MRKISWVCVGALLMVSGAAQAADGDGLRARRIDESFADNFQARLTLSTANSAAMAFGDPDGSAQRISSLSVMGDYYLTRPLGVGSSGGLRATSGLLLGPRSSLWGMPSTGHRFSIGQRSATQSLFDAANTDSGTAPYVGVGYTGLSPKNGWGVSADFGLMALRPSAVRLGHVLSSLALDDASGELRLSPVVQLGVSYSF